MINTISTRFFWKYQQQWYVEINRNGKNNEIGTHIERHRLLHSKHMLSSWRWMYVYRCDVWLWSVKLRHLRWLTRRWVMRQLRVLRMLRHLRMLYRVTRMWRVWMVHLHVRRLRWQCHAMRLHWTSKRLMRERLMRMHEAVGYGVWHADVWNMIDLGTLPLVFVTWGDVDHS